MAFLASSLPVLAGAKGAFMRVSPLKAGHSKRIECNNNPVNFTDPDGLLRRWPNGSVVSTLLYTVKSTYSPRRSNRKIHWSGWAALLYTDRGDNGKSVPIKATYNMSGDSRFDENCHGMTFTNEKGWWIDDSQVQQILDNDGYTELPEGEHPLPGDIAIFRENGHIRHSATIAVGGKNPWVYDISGYNTDRALAPLSTRQGWGDVTFYYRGSPWVR